MPATVACISDMYCMRAISPGRVTKETSSALLGTLPSKLMPAPNALACCMSVMHACIKDFLSCFKILMHLHAIVHNFATVSGVF